MSRKVKNDPEYSLISPKSNIDKTIDLKDMEPFPVQAKLLTSLLVAVKSPGYLFNHVK